MADSDADLMSLEHRLRHSLIPERAVIRFSLEDQAFQLDPRALNQLAAIRAIAEALARFEIQAQDIVFKSLNPGLDKGKYTRSAKSSLDFELRCPVVAAREAVALLEGRKDIAITGFGPDPALIAEVRPELIRRCLAAFKDEAAARAEVLGVPLLGIHRLSCSVSEGPAGLVSAEESGYFSVSKSRSAVGGGWRSSLSLEAIARGEVILGRLGDRPAKA